MMKIDVNTTTATLIPPRESLTPGSVNAVQLEFSFSDEWNGLTKTCVFSNELETVPAEMQNDITSVPTEVLDDVYRWISVGVSGEDSEGAVIIPTIWCRIGQCLPGVSGRFVTIDMLKAYWSKQEIVFELDGDGTKFLGDDGVYHYVSQGGGDVTHEELDAALALKADKDAFNALSATVDDKADKSEIITVTAGDGTKYLADDGTYKTITGGGDVTHEELDAAIAPLATKDEVSAAVTPLATKDELANATAGLATTAAMNAALALKADKTELASYAKQYDVNQALATKADKTETQNALAQKADKDEIITITTGAGTKFLADDGTYKTVQVDEKTFVAEYNVTTAQEIIAFADATKEPFAPILVKHGVDYYTVTTVSKQATNKVILVTIASLSGNYYTFTYTITDGTWASSSYGFQKLLESGVNIKTVGGQSLLGSGDIQLEAQMQADWNEADTTSPAFIQNKPAIPDVSGFETTEHAAVTYATKDDISGFVKSIGYQQFSAITDTPDENGKVTLTRALCGEYSHPDAETPGNYTATKAVIRFPLIDGVSGSLPVSFEYGRDGEGNYGFKNVKIDNAVLLTEIDAAKTYAAKSEIITVTTGSGTLFLADDGTYKPASGDPPDLSAYLTKTEAGTTYATQTALTEGLATKVDAATLGDYESTAHASATYATKTELTEGLAGKVDTADIADMLTKTEAEGTYADKVSLLTLENTVEAQRTLINNLDTNKADKTQIITVTSGSGTLFLADDGTYKPAAGDPPDLSAYLTKTEAGTTYATKTELADKADSATVTALSGVVTGHAAEIAALQTGKADKSELPDVSGFETTAHAEATYATKTELNAKADRTQLQGYLTRSEASETYETIARASKIKSITAAGHMVTVTDEGLANVGGTKVSRTTEVPQIGVSNVSLSVQQTLPATEESTTGEGGTLPITYTSTTSGALTQYTNFTIDGVPIATKDELPDTSNFLTITDAAATYQTIADASPIKSITAGELPVTVDANGDAQVGRTGVYIVSTETGGATTYTIDISETLPATSSQTLPYLQSGGTFTISYNSTNGVISDVKFRRRKGSDFGDWVNLETKENIAATYATKTEIADMATQTWVQQYIASLDGTNMQF